MEVENLCKKEIVSSEEDTYFTTFNVKSYFVPMNEISFDTDFIPIH